MKTLPRSLSALALLGLALPSLAAAVQEAGPPLDAGTDGDEALGEALEDAGPALPLMLRLLNGNFLWGEVRGHTPEHVVFERIDTGGRVRVPWRMLDPRQSEDLKTRFGYVDLSSEEILIEADRLIVGGEDVIGKIVNRTDTDIVLKTANSLVYVPKLRVQGAATTVQVPALDIYTKDELYAQESLRLTPETAEQHVELARFCERILAFDRALEHYAAAGELDHADLDVDLDVAMATAGRKAAAQAELEHLQQVDSLRARRKYDEALYLCDAFEELYPDSDLFPEVAQKRRRVERAREEALSEQVARSWHRWAGKLARDAARRMELAEVLAYVDGQMDRDIQDRVLADMHRAVGQSVEPDEVLNAWVNRRPMRWHKASYGYGTWLLGEASALEGLVEEDEEAEDTSLLNDEEKALQEKIKRYLANQKAVRVAKARGGQDDEERGAFWKIFPLDGKDLWILAYYAENSGQFELRKPSARACRECGGTGVREIVFSGGATSARTEGGQRAPRSQKIACPTCHHIGIVRRVTFR